MGRQAGQGGPWREPIADLLTRCGDPASEPLALAELNTLAAERAIVTLSARPVRFVAAAPDGSPGAARYERRIWEHGEVLTRLTGRGACHDGFNALCWLAFPKIRAALNALQALGLGEARPAPHRGDSSAARGALRDRVTLFDESGAVLVSKDQTLIAALRQADWERLFVEPQARQCWERKARLLVVGHALHEKLVRPYKAICARVLAIHADPGRPLAELDALAAQAILQDWRDNGVRDTAAPERAARALPPLPLLGIPGWWPGNQDPAFYRDPLVFRASRK